MRSRRRRPSNRGDVHEGTGGLRAESGEMHSATPKISPRQAQILELIASGRSDKEVAAVLGLSYRTVRTHLERLYARLGVHSRAEAVARWVAWRGSSYIASERQRRAGQASVRGSTTQFIVVDGKAEPPPQRG